AGPGVAVAAAEELQKEFPQVRIAGATAGSPQVADDASVRREITESKAEVLFVAYGVPKQEQWIARNLPKLPGPTVAVGVGGSFDYLAKAASLEGGGTATPPPGIVRRRGFEWLWRLVTRPSRWRRVFTAFPLFVRAVVRDARLDK
ncbi:MAG: WecB/TagA/CpsF family glycosyltransferase, partial [bacterium]|nr:WecB/TagA/CpsF family glycosyltransferase [bacterium]